MKRIFFGLVVLLSLQSCKEIIATDISETVPVILLPQVNDTVQNNPVHFKWEEVEGATKYHLQIVSPSFNNIEEYAIDSIVSGTSIYISLDSNEYELMLTAMNEGYTSHTLGPIKFWVGVQPSSSSGVVVLSSPAQDAYFNESFTGAFSWQVLEGAAPYEFSIRKGASYQSGTEIETQPGIVTSSYTLSSSLNEGEYHWGVKGYFQNGTETAVSTRRFYIDTINPVVPTLVSPTGSEEAGDITFTWTNATDPGNIHSPVRSYLEVADDVNFTIGVETTNVATTTGTLNISGIGTHYWRVRNKDEAGNMSSYSTVGQFTVFE